MKLLSVFAEKPIVEIIDDRNVMFSKSCYIDIVTDEGVLVYEIKAGFKTNGRSGPLLTDAVVPHFGNHLTLIAWIIHDCNYYELTSKEYADELLRQMLIFAGMSKFKARIVKTSVEWFGDDAYGIQSEEDEELKKLINIRRIAKIKESTGLKRDK